MSKESEPKKLRPGDPGYVGRGHTPVHTRIQPGEVRNPYGRRGKPKPDQGADDFEAKMAWLFAQPMVTADGKKISQETYVHNAILALMRKDTRALALYIEMREKYDQRRAAAEIAVETDERRQQLIEEAMARRQAQQAFAAQPENPDGLEPAEDDTSDKEEGGA
jgi:hypothetical protein